MRWNDETVFEGFNGNSRVWIYQSDRELTPAEVNRIQSDLDRFCSQWKAHGSQLAARGSVLFDRFAVLVVDEAAEPASGCSIDTSVHMIQQLGELFKIDFFDRLRVIYVDEDKKLSDFHSSETSKLIEGGQLTKDSIVFNNMILRLSELREDWRKPLQESWLSRYLT